MDDIHDEIKQEALNDQKPKGRNPLIWVFGAFLILILIMMVVPHYGIKPDNEPTKVPGLGEVLPTEPDNFERPRGNDIRLYVQADDPVVKRIATKVATEGCNAETICQSKAIYYFVRDNFKYVGEQDEYIQTPNEMLYTGGGDCDDFAVMIASMQQAIGVPTRFVKVPGHVYNIIYIDNAPGKYKQDGWIPMDATCSNCDFGDVPRKYKEEEKGYLW